MTLRPLFVGDLGKVHSYSLWSYRSCGSLVGCAGTHQVLLTNSGGQIGAWRTCAAGMKSSRRAWRDGPVV